MALNDLKMDQKKAEYQEIREAFEENTPHLYDMAILDYSLPSTSHTVQWLPLRKECKEDDRYNTEYFLMGTHNNIEGDENLKEHIMV